MKLLRLLVLVVPVVIVAVGFVILGQSPSTNASWQDSKEGSISLSFKVPSTPPSRATNSGAAKTFAKKDEVSSTKAASVPPDVASSSAPKVSAIPTPTPASTPSFPASTAPSQTPLPAPSESEVP